MKCSDVKLITFDMQCAFCNAASMMCSCEMDDGMRNEGKGEIQCRKSQADRSTCEWELKINDNGMRNRITYTHALAAISMHAKTSWPSKH